MNDLLYAIKFRDKSPDSELVFEFLAALDSITPQMSYCIDVNRKIVKVKKLNYGED